MLNILTDAEILSIIALNPLSCQAFKNVQSVQQRASVNIDVDGSGPLKPFPVTCEFFCKYFIFTNQYSDVFIIK